MRTSKRYASATFGRHMLFVLVPAEMEVEVKFLKFCRPN